MTPHRSRGGHRFHHRATRAQRRGRLGRMDVPNLTRDDARVRADLLALESYDITLDVTDPAGQPAERMFRSRTEIRFTATQPGASTFVDLLAETDPRGDPQRRPGRHDGYEPADGLVLTDLAADNVLVVDADMLFTNTGEGLHRFQDPVDGEVYLYSQFETADAKRMFACFDQPDLKATFTFGPPCRRTGRPCATAPRTRPRRRPRRQDRALRDDGPDVRRT